MLKTPALKMQITRWRQRFPETQESEEINHVI